MHACGSLTANVFPICFDLGAGIFTETVLAFECKQTIATVIVRYLDAKWFWHFSANRRKLKGRLVGLLKNGVVLCYNNRILNYK